MNEMNANVAEARLKSDKEREDSRKVYDELAAVKKVSGLFSQNHTDNE